MERNEEMKRLIRKEQWTLQQVADKFGVSRQRASQIVGATRAGFNRLRARRAFLSGRLLVLRLAGYDAKSAAREVKICPSTAGKVAREFGDTWPPVGNLVKVGRELLNHRQAGLRLGGKRQGNPVNQRIRKLGWDPVLAATTPLQVQKPFSAREERLLRGAKANGDLARLLGRTPGVIYEARKRRGLLKKP